jgi:hypothetical protein
MPGVDFRLLRERIAVREVLELLQFEPIVRRGDQWRGPCPVHGSRNPRSRSFSLNVRMGRYLATTADREATPWNYGRRYMD